jgi:hypothetical protein
MVMVAEASVPLPLTGAVVASAPVPVVSTGEGVAGMGICPFVCCMTLLLSFVGKALGVVR